VLSTGSNDRRVYRLKPSWIAFFLLGALFFLGTAIRTAQLPEAEAAWFVPLSFAGFGLCTLLPLRTRVELDDHWIAVHNGVSMRRLDRRRVMGRRIRQYRHVSLLQLLTDAPGLKPLGIPLMLRFDAEFDEWLATLRDFDVEERADVFESLAASHDDATRYSLVLGPWGPRSSSDSVDVSQRVYERVEEGSDVRVVLRDGRFRMPWFYVVP
jgi:hypothetical protein